MDKKLALVILFFALAVPQQILTPFFQGSPSAGAAATKIPPITVIPNQPMLIQTTTPISLE